MKKKTAILIFMIQMTVLGVAQTPKDSCSIPKDSLCQERIAKSKIALPKNDIYREKFMNLQLINIIGSHLSR